MERAKATFDEMAPIHYAMSNYGVRVAIFEHTRYDARRTMHKIMKAMEDLRITNKVHANDSTGRIHLPNNSTISIITMRAGESTDKIAGARYGVVFIQDAHKLSNEQKTQIIVRTRTEPRKVFINGGELKFLRGINCGNIYTCQIPQEEKYLSAFDFPNDIDNAEVLREKYGYKKEA